MLGPRSAAGPARALEEHRGRAPRLGLVALLPTLGEVHLAGMAGSCDARLFMTKFKAPKGMLAALFSQFVLLPAVGFASVTLFPQDAVTVVTLLVVTTSPGGGFSGRPATPSHTPGGPC